MSVIKRMNWGALVFSAVTTTLLDAWLTRREMRAEERETVAAAEGFRAGSPFDLTGRRTGAAGAPEAPQARRGNDAE